MLKLIILILISVCLIDAPLFAYENKAALDYNGVSGIWFDEPTATSMLQDLTEFSILKNKKIPSLEVDLQLHKKSIELYKEEIEVMDQITLKYKSALDDSENVRKLELDRYNKELSKKNVWYKSTPFIFVVGIISGALLSVGLVFGLNQGAK
jgi:hypothetical protein